MLNRTIRLKDDQVIKYYYRKCHTVKSLNSLWITRKQFNRIQFLYLILPNYIICKLR